MRAKVTAAALAAILASLPIASAFAGDLTVPPLPRKGASAYGQAPVMPVKAPRTYTQCSVTECSGLFIGGVLANNGGTFNVISTGLNGLAQNGLGLGGNFGWEFWNGQIYAAFVGDVTGDTFINAGVNGGGGIINPNFKNSMTYGVEARLGYSLAAAFGFAATSTTTPTLPQQLLASLMTPYVAVGEAWRFGQPALRSGVGVEALIATNWTLDAEYLHYSYNQGGTAGTIVGFPVQMTDDNEFRLSVNYHLCRFTNGC